MAVARDVFALEALRPGQADVIAAAEAGRDVLFVAPTGAGKSVAYWIPALAGNGLALVVSPLIALMTDQVERLRRAGVAAAAIHSQLDQAGQRERLALARRGALRFLYVAPERFATPGFDAVLADLGVARFIVDEAHCISSWGHDFRPDYRRLAAAIARCGRPPVTAVTATATPRVRADIGASLGLRDPVTRVTGFVRPELTLEVWRCRTAADKSGAISRALADRPGRALVYCGRTRDCDETAAALRAEGIAAAGYHGGLEGSERQEVQTAFSWGRLRVVVATSAFGMGVDIADIRQVIHRDFPGSIEAYYQEAGRAGRDGRAARCLLLYRGSDRDLQEFFIEQSYPDGEAVRAVYRALLRAGRWDLQDIAGLVPGVDRHQVEAALRLLEGSGVLLPDGAVRRLSDLPVDFAERARLKENAHARLDQMMAYATTTGCRMARIADYFGEEGAARSCSSCDNCRAPRRPVEVPAGAVLAGLQAVARFDGHLGAARIAAVLRGADSSWSRERPWLRRLEPFGALAAWGDEQVRDLIDGLVERGLVRRGHGERPTLSLTPRGLEMLRGGAQPAAIPVGPSPAAAPATPTGRRGQDGTVELRFERLRAWRLAQARAEGRPAFTVFADRTLREIASRDPRSPAELLGIFGVGPAKASRYGPGVLAVLKELMA
jgi:ATP-dependent DNA helicase RecQ